MLKLHPHQISSYIRDTLCPSSATTDDTGDKAAATGGGARNRSGTLIQGKVYWEGK